MKIINCFKSKISIIFLFFIPTFYIVNNYFWLKLNSPFPTFYYYAFDFKRVIEFYEVMKASRWDLVVSLLVNTHDAYIYSLTAAIIAFIFGKSTVAITLFNNTPYFAIAIFSIYRIARKIADRSTALLAVVIFSLYPAVYGTSRLYILEFAVMGMAPLCILYLLNTEEFTNRKYSLLFGLALGWGMLIKYSLVAFIIGPLVHIIGRILILNRRDISSKTVRLSSPILNIGLSALVAMAIMGIKYFNFNNTKSYLLRPLYQANVKGPWYIFDNLRIYTLGIFEQQLSLFFFLLLIFGFYGFLVKIEKKISIIFFYWVIIPWLILLAMPHFKMAHFIIPYLPAMALISAIGFMNILKNRRKLKSILITLIIIIGIAQYYDFSFGFWPSFSNYRIRMKYKAVTKDIHYYLLSDNICGRPKNDEVYNKVIYSIASRCNMSGRNVVRLPPGSVYSYDNPHVWYCIRWFKKLPFKIFIFEENISFFEDVLYFLEKSDFILYSDATNINIKDPLYLDGILRKSKQINILHFNGKNLEKLDQFTNQDLQIWRKEFNELINKFELLETISCMQDGRASYSYLYKKS
jgi:hypothetical protein